MKLALPSLKHRRPIVYISLAIYSFLSTFIIVESCIPGGLSGLQSRIFATISAWFVNNVKGDQVNKTVNPIAVTNFTDTSYLGREDEVSNIGIGTTTLATLEVSFPTTIGKNEVYDQSYTITREENYGDYYSTVVYSSMNKNKMNLYVRVTGKKVTEEAHNMTIKFAGSVQYNYSFKIIDLPAPVDFLAKVEKEEIKIGEALPINVQLKDEEKGKDDYYLRRYFDLKKIERSSSNENVAIIDEFGVIHGRNAGNTEIKYGKHTFNITVINDTIIPPASNVITLSVDPSSNANPSLLDYDDVFYYDSETKAMKYDHANTYSTLVYANIDEQTVSWDVSDDQKVKLAPYKYDDNGYPIYHDDDGRQCVRVCGYREKGEVTLTAISNYDSTIKKDLVLTVGEAYPTSMTINIKDTLEMNVNDQKAISGTFAPNNVNNKNIHVESSSDIISITNNDTTSVTIKAVKKGTAHITVTSVANESLKCEFDVKATAKKAINDDNYDSFHRFMRKAAGHFSLFLVTAIFGFIFFYTYFETDKRFMMAIVLTLGLGFITAGISELIQLVIPGRGGVFTDVLIDFTGCCFGVLIVFAIILISQYIKRVKKNRVE